MKLAFLFLLSLTSTLGKDITNGVVSKYGAIIGKRITDKPSLKVADAEVCDHVWMYYSNGTCRCGADIRGTIRCSTDPVRVSVLAYICMTYEDDKVGVVTATCPYGYGDWYGGKSVTSISSYDPNYHPIPSNMTELNSAVCGRMKRDGLLCSKCRDGYSPLVYSYDLNCVKCSNNDYNCQWLKFTAVTFVPLTLFYFVVVLFRINATNPYLYGFIAFNQVFTAPINLRAAFFNLEGTSMLSQYKYIPRIVALPMTIWNLDFFRSLKLNICLNITTLQTITLDYVIALYPLLLIAATYALVQLHARGCRLIVQIWRPFNKCCARFSRIMDIQSSIIKAFATFLLLSYVKLVDSTLNVLFPTIVYNVHGQIVGVYVYYDASYKYFSKEHVPYAAVSIILFLIFVVSPLLLLLLYPTRCCQKRLNICGHGNARIALHTFVEGFQGHFKDGTEPGTRDCRWFSAVYFLGRITTMYAIFFTSDYARGYIAAAGLSLMLYGINLSFLAIVMLLLQPYKLRRVNYYHAVLMLILAIDCFISALVSQSQIHWISYTGIFLIALLSASPLLYALAYVTINHTPCRRFIDKRCWQKLPRNQNHDDPELERLLQI